MRWMTISLILSHQMAFSFCSSKRHIHCTKKLSFLLGDFYSKCDQIRKRLRIWSDLLKKYLMENFIFCAVIDISIKVILSYICRKKLHLQKICETSVFWSKDVSSWWRSSWKWQLQNILSFCFRMLILFTPCTLLGNPYMFTLSARMSHHTQSKVTYVFPSHISLTVQIGEKGRGIAIFVNFVKVEELELSFFYIAIFTDVTLFSNKLTKSFL